MRVLLLILFLYPFVSWADSCDRSITYSDNNLHLKISYNVDCEGGGRIYFTRKMGADGKPDSGDMYQKNAFDFKSECSLNINQTNNSSVLSCHAGGHTPLAGAKYQLKQVGTYKLDCGMLEGNAKQPRMRYVCISGCSKSAPKFLDQVDPCD